MPEISIITAAYKAESFIANAARSVLAQEFADFEWVIASDDGQDYLSVLAAQGIQDTRIRQVYSKGGGGKGPTKARNTALEAAAGRFIATMDSDDMLMPDTLAVMHPLAQQHGAAYSDITYQDLESQEMLTHFNRAIPAGFHDLENILTSNIQTFAWLVFDRECLPSLHWRPEVDRWEDVLFFADCADELGGIYHVPRPLYHYHRRAGSICNRAETGEEFHSWAKKLLDMVSNEILAFKHKETKTVLERYLLRRIDIEKRYIREVEAGTYTTYLQFMKDHWELFYSLQ